MNQHPRAKEMGITAGPWTKQKDHSSVYSPNGLLIEGNYNEPDLQLCADAGNVMNQTGRTPSELVELVRELRERLSFFIALVRESQGVSGWHLNGDVAMWGDWQDEVDLSSDILEKTEGFA